uniref:Uncharacterized protein n=1 Tax=Timema shepardi TaxID=629360 RepID=A0A7R9G0Q4_TIMSH|nr:unnamed protein product [Timema shepardi]
MRTGPMCVWRESGKPLWKTILENHFGKNLTTPDRDSNLNLPIIGSLVYCKSSVLDHAASEAGLIPIVYSLAFYIAVTAVPVVENSLFCSISRVGMSVVGLELKKKKKTDTLSVILAPALPTPFPQHLSQWSVRLVMFFSFSLERFSLIYISFWVFICVSPILGHMAAFRSVSLHNLLQRRERSLTTITKKYINQEGQVRVERLNSSVFDFRSEENTSASKETFVSGTEETPLKLTNTFKNSRSSDQKL